MAATVDRQSHIAEGWMKENAPWTDRTSNARNGLRAVPEHVPGTSHAIDLLHSVSYGIWLETRHEGRYAIIIPALKDQGVKLMQTLEKLFARLGRAR